jgi:hypothetical protein
VGLELLLLAIASAVWPLLLAVVIIALRAPHPPRLLISFLAGGLLTTVVVGLLVIHLLRATTLLSQSRSTTDPVAYIAAGTIALVLGSLLLRRTRAEPYPEPEPEPEPAEKPPGRLDRMLSKGVLVAFVVGVIVNIVPGVFPFVALKDIAEADYGNSLTVLVVICFYLIMFALIEVPLVAYVVAPERTAIETARFNTWLDHNSRRVAAYVLCVVGAFLLVRGITAAITA